MILLTIITKVSHHSTPDIKRLRGSTHWSGLIGTSVEGCHGSRFAWTEPCHRNIPTLLPYIRLGNSWSSPPEPALVSNFVSKTSAYSVQEFLNYQTMHIARMLLQTWKDEIQAQTPSITTLLGHLVRENHLSVDCGLRAAFASKRKQSSFPGSEKWTEEIKLH